MDLLRGDKEPTGWRSLHVGGVNCEHMQALLTNYLQRHWEWQEDRRTDLEPGFAGLDAKTAFGCGQAVSGIEDPLSDGCSWARGASFPG